MSDEKKRPRTSRFRRSSRFRSPKEPARASEKKKEEAPATPPAEEKTPPETPPAEVAPVAVAQTNVITVNVKEWFQSPALSDVIKFSHWGKYERRVEMGIHMILSILRQHDVKATFFVLGIVAREFPELIKMISSEGHEVGTMGYYNRRLHSIPPGDYIKEIEMSVALLKSLTGKDVALHRAPNWSVTQHTLWVMEILRTFNINYDSSIFPVNAILYGIENAPRFPYLINPSGIIEFPPSTLSIIGKNISLFWSTFFRMVPYGLIKMAIKNINSQGYPVMVSVSPWEVEGGFPRMDLGLEGYLSQHAGVGNTASHLTSLLGDFSFNTMTSVLETNPPTDSVHLNTLQDKRKGNVFE